MRFLKHTFTYDLYIRNQEVFHKWLKKAKKAILGSGFFWLLATIILIFSCVAVVVTINNQSEITTYEYTKITEYAETYGEEIPEYRILLKKVMEDNFVTEGEYKDLTHLLREYWAERDRLRKLEAKADLVKSISD